MYRNPTKSGMKSILPVSQHILFSKTIHGPFTRRQFFVIFWDDNWILQVYAHVGSSLGGSLSITSAVVQPERIGR